MKEGIKKEALYDFDHVILILENRELMDVEKLKELSDHAIEDVAVLKDLDVISITVLIYSIYKVVKSLNDVDYRTLLGQLKKTRNSLQQGDYGSYNNNMKLLFDIVRRGNAQVREHLQDVMQAARIKKGTTLLEKGLSIGQAAGLMGLSNWDLQQYAGKTPVLGSHNEAVPAKLRVKKALLLFGVESS